VGVLKLTTCCDSRIVGDLLELNRSVWGGMSKRSTGRDGPAYECDEMNEITPPWVDVKTVTPIIAFNLKEMRSSCSSHPGLE